MGQDQTPAGVASRGALGAVQEAADPLSFKRNDLRHLASNPSVMTAWGRSRLIIRGAALPINPLPNA
jgi:hypothetical protein